MRVGERERVDARIKVHVGDVDVSIERRELVLDRAHVIAIDAHFEAAREAAAEPQFVALVAGHPDVTIAVPGVLGGSVCSAGSCNQRAGPQGLIAARDDRRGALIGDQPRVLALRVAGKASHLRARWDRHRIDRAERSVSAFLRGAAVGQCVRFTRAGRARESSWWGSASVATVRSSGPSRRACRSTGGRLSAGERRSLSSGMALGRKRERVEVGPGDLVNVDAVAQRQPRRAVLGRLDRSAFAEEVTVGIDFVLVDERWPLARDELADVLQLGQRARAARASRRDRRARSTRARRRREPPARALPRARRAVAARMLHSIPAPVSAAASSAGEEIASALPITHGVPPAK